MWQWQVQSLHTGCSGLSWFNTVKDWLKANTVNTIWPLYDLYADFNEIHQQWVLCLINWVILVKQAFSLVEYSPQGGMCTAAAETRTLGMLTARDWPRIAATLVLKASVFKACAENRHLLAPLISISVRFNNLLLFTQQNGNACFYIADSISFSQ